MTKSLLISGTHSGCGKTSLTLGLLASLARRGFRCAPFKTGPDFIDPGLHALACGRISHNLDSWMLPEAANREIFERYSAGADVAVVEGAMGLFDGASATNEKGSAAHMAKMLGIPVLLVLDASGMARSAAALASGFARFDPELTLAGVVCNRSGGPGHREMLREAIEDAGISVLGCLPKASDLAMPSRHLGLVTAQDLDARPGWMERLADWVEAGVDVDALLASLPDTGGIAPQPEGEARPRVRLGVARDRAFCFAYAENLRLLESAGAELVFFSPLADQGLPADLDGLYLPGGYPELHAGTLSANAAMLQDIRNFCASGRPVYAECGGFMALMESVRDAQGREWPMAGVFPCRAAMGQRFAALGYREARFTADTPLGPAGTTARGHEFHYSSLEAAPDAPAVYALSGRKGIIEAQEGFLSGNTLASYVHLHFASNPDIAGFFVAAMACGRKARP
ncbi:cobyrinate a,c-diamide synthase [Fundidesulfovibrio terrae]|uniref:cobyrinate a,c-diamide synthase n=1 Tax=Fundidesulfovibrio terrae TaxID=2922866 RepID=UPI001FAEC6B9|nr:cobyrinate a,c-diamide synthase [Fundidesulfovibrio terrae]